VSEILWVLRRRSWVIISSVVLAFLGFGVYLVARKPVYEARTEILIEPPALNGIQSDSEMVPAWLMGNWRAFSRETTAEILKGRPVMTGAIRRLALLKRLRGDAAEAKSLKEAMRRALPPDFLAALDGNSEDERLEAEMAGYLADLIEIHIVKHSFVLEIVCRTGDPKLSAAMANAIVVAYCEYDKESRLEQFNSIMTWLEQHKGDYERKLLETHKGLVEAAKELDEDLRRTPTGRPGEEIVESSSSPLTESVEVLALRIKSLTREVAQAEKEAMMTRDALETLQGWIENGGETVVLPTDLESSAVNLDEMTARIHELEARRRASMRQFGPKHPDVLELDREIKGLQQEAHREIERTLERIRASYELVLRNLSRSREMLAQARAKAVNVAHRQVDNMLLVTDADSDRTFYERLTSMSKNLDLAQRTENTGVKVLSAAIPPEQPMHAGALRISALVLISSALFGIALALALDLFDQTIRDTDEVERLFSMPVLGYVSEITNSLVAREQEPGRRPLPKLILPTENNLAAENLRSLRTNIVFLTMRGCKALAFTSSLPMEGKSTLVSNLAVMLAFGGKRVLLIDADMRKPILNKVFGVAREPGLSSVLAGKCHYEDAIIPTDISGIDIMPSGPPPPNPTELLQTEKVVEMLDLIRDIYDYILIDTPPVCNVADAGVISQISDSVVVVARAGRTQRNALSLCIRQLYSVNSPIIGLVLNGFGPDSQGYGYYGYRGYSDYGYYHNQSYYAREAE